MAVLAFEELRGRLPKVQHVIRHNLPLVLVLNRGNVNIPFIAQIMKPWIIKQSEKSEKRRQC